ncbi:MAG: hypothetical protein LBS12_05980, partial [Prevotellaceae bacterium]|nr:hypothetical protein [Prevotellaceae bacterium]
MGTNDVILEIKVEYTDAVVKIAEFQQKIEETKKVQEGLKQSLEEGTITKQEYRESVAASKIAIDSYKKSIQLLEKEVKDNLKIEREQTGSINQLRAALSLSTAAYNKMSEAERNAAKGKELLKDISDTTAKLKELEEAHGDHRRSVGDYEKATRSLRMELREYVAQLAQMKLEGKENTQEYQNLAENASKLRDTLDDVNQTVNAGASDTKYLSGVAEGLKTAIGGFGLLQSAIGLTETENEKLRDVMQKTQIVMTAINSLTAIQTALQKQSSVMQLVAIAQERAKATAIALSTKSTIGATAAQKVFNFIASMNPYVMLALALVTVIGALAVFSSSTQKAGSDIESQNRLFERQKELNNEYIESLRTRGETAARVALEELNAEWKLSQQKIATAEHEMRINREGSEAHKAATELLSEAHESYRETYRNTIAILDGLIAKQRDLDLKSMYPDEYQYQIEKINDDLQEQLNLIATLKEKHPGLIKQYEEYAAAAQRVAAADIAAVKKKQDEAEQKIAAERAKTLLDITRKLEDETIKILTDAREKAYAEQSARHSRELADLRRSYADKTKLSKEAAAQLAALEKAMQERQAAESAQLTAQLNAQALTDKLAFEQKKIQLQIDAAKAGTDAEFAARMAMLQNRRLAELAENAQLVENKRQDEAAINAKYDAEELQARQAQDILIDNEDELRISLKIFTSFDFVQELLSYGATVKILQP